MKKLDILDGKEKAIIAYALSDFLATTDSLAKSLSKISNSISAAPTGIADTLADLRANSIIGRQLFQKLDLGCTCEEAMNEKHNASTD